MTNRRTAIAWALGAAGIVLWLAWSLGPWGANSEDDTAVSPWMAEGDHEPSEDSASLTMRAPAPEKRTSGAHEDASNQHWPAADAAALGDVHGTVEDVLGKRLAGVRLALLNGDAASESAQHTVHTDLDGAFAFPPALRGELTCVDERYTLVYDSGSAPPTDGQALARRLVLAARASLILEVKDWADQPIPEARIHIEIGREEEFATRKAFDSRYRGWSLDAQTSAKGLVTIPAVPAQQHLVVSIDGKPYERQTVGGELVGVEEPGSWLWLHPGEARRGFVVRPKTIELFGTIYEPNGKPSPFAHVSTRSPLYLARGLNGYVGGERSDAEGKFRFTIQIEAEEKEMILTANGTVGEKPSYSPFGGSQAPDPLHSGWDRFPLSQVGHAWDLHLQAMPKIAGRVVDDQEKGVSATLYLMPLEAFDLDESLLTSRPKQVQCDKDGFFQFPAVPPGTYQVDAEAKGFAHTYLSHVQAGQTDLLLRMESQTPIELKLRVHAEVELKQTIALCTRLLPKPTLGRRPAVLAAETQVRGPSGWPVEATGVWYGSSNYSGPLGKAQFGMTPIEGDTHVFHVVPGWYWIGAKASLSGGGVTFPVGTGLTRLEQGTYTVDLYLEPSARIEGRILGHRPGPRAAGEEVCIAFAQVGGPLIAVQGRAKPLQEVHALASNGTFAFSVVPVGNYELRLGTRQTLQSGMSSARRGILTSAGETHVIEWNP